MSFMDAFVCLDAHHDVIIDALSEKYMCTHYNPDDARGCANKNNACNVLAMMCSKPPVIVCRHIDTISQIPTNFSGKRVLFTVKSPVISKELEIAVGGMHRMFLCDNEDDEVTYMHNVKTNTNNNLSKCKNWSDLVSFVTRKPKYRKEFLADFLFISICIDVIAH